jgi:hypothetical protein
LDRAHAEPVAIAAARGVASSADLETTGAFISTSRLKAGNIGVGKI